LKSSEFGFSFGISEVGEHAVFIYETDPDIVGYRKAMDLDENILRDGI
jgi:hypothetical protein